ncbi:HNH endonuclease [Streptomyces sp. YIM 121038]|uniref:HNH endonuclease n=1 Tax=Streptomyces sp. YIM 121038 TaxID=2136401 RepID=UPI0011104793|nr:HNH endonuclease signature motif containing protein [Streptomyces sp. YIM 121038]QCX81187.1 HNH endonuclease [Streptomyces sp. YIM 121038]
MPRIRTVKPEFWEDELLGVMPRDARLLFIATFNMADDEGILRWTPAYIKAQAFMYDDDLTIKDVDQLMRCLTDTGLVFPYIGGAARQQMAVIVNFRKHQRINRPQKSKLPPPSTGAWQVREMYARRDGWVCQLCGGEIPRRLVVNDDHNLWVDHIRPVAAGGTDHPSNVRAVHRVCGRSRGACESEEGFIPPAGLAGIEDSLNDSLNRSVNDPVKETHTPLNFDVQTDTDGEFSSMNHSLTEGKGKEGNRERKGPPPTPRQSSGSPTVAQTGERAIEDRMTDAFLQRYGRGNAYKQRQVRKVVADALANSTDSSELWRALERLGSLSKPVSAGTLQFAFSEIRQAQNASNVIALPSGQTLTGTDATVAGWAALAVPPPSEDSA